jgi:hypothetical protein
MRMRLCAVCEAILNKLRLRDSVRSRFAQVAGCIRVRKVEEVVMARVIEFYIPRRFRKPLNAPPQAQFGKIIEFCLQTKKSA